jgi:MDMPI C-terminal domain
VVHRIDAEQAAGLPVTTVPDDLAVDGVDEVLKRFLGYDFSGLGQLEGGHPADGSGQDTITVLAGQTAWTARPSPREVVVEDGASENPCAVIQAAPDPLLRWLWGRAGDDAVRLTGDAAWAGYLRRMLAAATR